MLCVARQLSWAAVQGAAYNVRRSTCPALRIEAYRRQQAQSRMEELLYAADERKLNRGKVPLPAGGSALTAGFGRVVLCKQPQYRI
jgi:hypothetical protein